MFDEELANELQFITFALEVLGVTLAFIEIKYPALADKIERFIRDSEHAVRRLGERLTDGRLIEWTMTIFIIVFFLSLADWWDLYTLPWFVWVIFGIVYAVVGLIFGLFLIEELIKFLNHSSNGRALGALGIALAMLGLIGDLIQIYIIFIS
jgi:hypothetical protein